MRNTKQKDLIFNIINDAKNHPTAKDIYKMARTYLPSISLGTVYRNINVLLLNNKIKKVGSFDGKDHYDNINIRHNHFVCLKCNKIFDVFDSISLKNINDFEIINCDTIYSGYCSECKKGK